MTGPAKFGDFVVVARRNLAAARYGLPSVMPGGETQQLAGSLTSLVLVLARYARDLTRTVSQVPGSLAAGLHDWERAALDSDYALESALGVLQSVPGIRASA